MLDPPGLRASPLEALHAELGARMVPFAGWSLPVQYPAGILAEHRQCRERAALFDVSHMGQASLHGAHAAAALERVALGDLVSLRPGRKRYSLLTNDHGGILDDFMVANLGDRLFLVVNASRAEADFAHIESALPADVRLERHPDRALLALQGPLAASVLASISPSVGGQDHRITVMAGLDPAIHGVPPMTDQAIEPDNFVSADTAGGSSTPWMAGSSPAMTVWGEGAFKFMAVAETDIAGIPVIAARSGYTGEDGFELSVAADRAEELARLLLARQGVAPAGLGARDSLRLEAGLPLYGQDLDELTTPVEAGLTWAIGKRRRMAGDFPGAAAIRAQLDNGPPRIRVGLLPEGRAPVRAGVAILDGDGTTIGLVTSGTFSPTRDAPIAMGYVRPDFAADGTSLTLMLRGKPVAARVAALPFVPHRYVR